MKPQTSSVSPSAEPQGDGVAEPKVDVTASKGGEVNTEEARRERSSVEQERRRARDTHPAGLSASEMIRFEFLSRKPDINEEERSELRALGFKREYGMPEAQHQQVIEDATRRVVTPATKESLVRESSEGRAKALKESQKTEVSPFEVKKK